jgi:ubiquinone/menaquinone biosynthesis C-methylase UbiE
MTTETVTVTPSLDRFFETVHAFHRTAALKAALQLDVFTAIGSGATDAANIATVCSATERGIRILCDYLTVVGFLTKTSGSYALTVDSATFLDRHSAAFVGGALEFLLGPSQVEGFNDLAAAVRRGGTTLPDRGVLKEDHAGWVSFARGMAPIMAFPAERLAQTLGAESGEACRVLDIAAGHGLYGIAIGRQNPRATIVAVDWPTVLNVARQNAVQAGLGSRYETCSGNALQVDWGANYDIALLTNILHHFDLATCEELLARVGRALKTGGRAAILEFIPDEDRISPPIAAQFGLMMLGTTPHGDAYTYEQYRAVLGRTGFGQTELRDLPPTYFRVVIAEKTSDGSVGV